VLVVAYVLNAWLAFNTTVLTATGHGRAAARGAGVSILVNGVLVAVLVPPLGAEGAAAAMLAATVVRNLQNSRAVRREPGLRTAPI
jgi:O-antigen/teichoic acid export membrane protein